MVIVDHVDALHMSIVVVVDTVVDTQASTLGQLLTVSLHTANSAGTTRVRMLSKDLSAELDGVRHRAEAKRLVADALAALGPDDRRLVLVELLAETEPQQRTGGSRPVQKAVPEGQDFTSRLKAHIKRHPTADTDGLAKAVYGADDAAAKKRVRSLLHALLSRDVVRRARDGRLVLAK